MKKLIVLLLAAMLLLSLCACANDLPEGDVNMQITAKPKTETETLDDVAETEEITELVETAQTEETTEPEEVTVDDEMLKLAESCVDKNVSELYALIGQPTKADYAPSCLVDGEDGMLYYDGFVVYTVVENGVETVYYVEHE